VTLTNRLLLYFLATLAAVLLAFSAAVDALARAHLRATIDADLVGALNALAGSVEVEARGVEWEPDKPKFVATRSSGGATRWAVRADRPLLNAHSDDPPGSPPLPVFDRPDATPFDYADAEGRPWRAVVRVVVAPDSTATVAADENFHRWLRLTVAVNREPERRALRGLELGLLAVSMATLGLAAAGGRWVCRRALAPVRRMADAARGVTAADLRARLAVPTPDDELRELASQFNGLLARLEESFERQRHFTAEASHQLRTPLAGLRGALEVSLRRERDPAEYRRTLAAAVTQTDRLTGIVESLLFLARADAESRPLDCEAVELGAWLAAHLDATWAAHPRAGDLRRDFAVGESLTVTAQPTLLAQAFDNVLDNAFKYSEPGSPVVVILSGDGDGVTLSVTDRGVGIPAEALPRVFEPFYRADAARLRGVKGHGLGLAVTARVVAALDGRVTANSTASEGTTVGIRLPRLATTPQ